MTRKRFIKLQMAQGYSRNTAEALARRARAAGWSYAVAFDKLTAARCLIAGMADGLKSVLDPVCAWMRQVARAAAAAGAAFQKVMEEANNER